MIIRNMPDDAMDYEFIVVIPNGGHYTFIGKYVNGNDAEKIALEYGGVVIHNVRIQGYRESKSEKKHYIFSGTWSWDCWAIDVDDAEWQFSKAYDEDINIDYEHKIKVDE